MVLSGCLLFIGLTIAGLWLLFASMITHVRIPLSLRFGFNNIARNLQDSALQVVGIGLALTSILSLTLVKNHLLTDWQQQLAPETPNYFVFNVEPYQKLELNNFLIKNQVKVGNFFPIVRGRLTAINNKSVNTLFGAEVKNINALQRELNLSWSDKLPADNHIIAGSWTVAKTSKAWVSVERSLAEQLKVHLGDILTFNISDKEVHGVITSIREVDWTSFNPNFFMLFKPGVLDDVPQTVLTSFYLPSSLQNILVDMNRTFPNVSVIDIAQTLISIQAVLSSAGNALNFITLFALLAGLIIVILAVISLNRTKQQETRVLKILGMRQRSLLWVRSSEACLIGLYTGILATSMAILLNWILVTTLFDSLYTIPWRLFISIPLGTAVFMVGINVLIQKKQYQTGY